MKRIDIASRLARRRRISRARAADCVDRVVHDILKKLRSGQPAELPGLGRLEPGKPVRLYPGKPAPKTRKRGDR